MIFISILRPDKSNQCRVIMKSTMIWLGTSKSSLGSSHKPKPNPYEDPRCQETNSPLERIFVCFSAVLILASSGSRTVFCLGFPVQVRTPCVCTTHFLRLCRHGDGECRETCMCSAAASKHLRALLPSYAKTWLHSWCSPVRSRGGGGAAPRHRE